MLRGRPSLSHSYNYSFFVLTGDTPLLVLTPQVIDHCALKPMSFLLLSVAPKAPSYLPLSIFSPLLLLIVSLL